MPDDTLWDVPAKAIADSRAKYYAKNDAVREGANYQTVYDEELAYTLDSDDELIDWASNNMNWSDISINATKAPCKPKQADYQEGWVNGDKEIVLK